MITLTAPRKQTLLAMILSIIAGLSTGFTAEELAGEWDMKIETDGPPRLATLTFTKNSDGSFSGHWGSTELSKVTLEENKLTFVQTRRRRDREFSQTFTGTLKDGKLEGVLASEQSENKMTGARPVPKSPVLGHWDVRYQVRDRDIEARLRVSEKKDGSLHADWKQERGEHTITRVHFEEGQLTLDRTVKYEDNEFDVTHSGKIEGHKLAGTVITSFGEIEMKGARHGTELIGTWELTTTTDRGPRTRRLKVYSDLTGRYETFGRELPVELKLNEKKVSFDTEMRFGDRSFEFGLRGELEAGNKLTGELVTSRGSTAFTGVKLVKAKPLAAVGTWEFTRETNNGVRTSTLIIKDDKSGSYSFRDQDIALDTLSLEGDQVAFKVTLKFSDREIPLAFKGTVDESTLKGTWTTPRGEREATGKRKP